MIIVFDVTILLFCCRATAAARKRPVLRLIPAISSTPCPHSFSENWTSSLIKSAKV